MILDAASTFSSTQAVTVTAPSTFVFDVAGVGAGNPDPNIFGTAAITIFGSDLGSGGPLVSPPQLVVYVNTAFTAGGAGTLRVQLQAAPDTATNTGTPGTYKTLLQTDDFALATLVAGQQIANFTIPKRYPGSDPSFPRFYRLNYVVTTGPMTAGAVSAYLSTGNDDNPIFPANF